MQLRGGGAVFRQFGQHQELIMLVGELIELLQSWPETCAVVVQLRKAEDGSVLYEFRDVAIETVVRSYDTIQLQLEE